MDRPYSEGDEICWTSRFLHSSGTAHLAACVNRRGTFLRYDGEYCAVVHWKDNPVPNWVLLRNICKPTDARATDRYAET